ncbi:MAG: galactose oxidase-like domain-containing protein [Cupriavidus necator]
MKNRHKALSLAVTGTCSFWLIATPVGTVLAADGCPAAGPAVCGEKSGLIPIHKDFIHTSLIWNKKYSECPKMLIWMRPSEYKPKHYLNPPVQGGGFPGFNQKYIALVQGGFGLGQLDESGWSRYSSDLERENAQIVDVCGLQSLIDTGTFTKTAIADLTSADISYTDPFFSDAGFSRGLGYNLFCTGHVAGIDGRIYVVGLHDKGGNNGGRKVNIFDPKTEQWVFRPVPCVRSGFESDPTGVLSHCDPLKEDNTDPPISSDMEYQRWYPTAVTLPDGKILVLSGSDQNTAVGSTNASATKVRQAVPEVYDPKTDTTVALENARKLLPMYPRAFVVQTGPGENDWKVAVTSEVVPPLPGEPGGLSIRGYDPYFYSGRTYLFDVQAALADPLIAKEAQNHWAYVDTAQNAHDSGAGVIMVTINADGTWSQDVFLFGGSNGGNTPGSAVAETINFSSAAPKWKPLANLALPVSQNNVVALPDGKLLVVGGAEGSVNSLAYQMFNPADGSRTDVVTSPVPRHDHSTALLMPNGGVWVMGGNRVNLIPGSPQTPQTQAQRDAAVPVLEFYKPPYFFKGAKPVINNSPNSIHYGNTFKLDVSAAEVESVALVRTGPITHNWTWGNRYVKLPVRVQNDGKLDVTAPPLPGLAIAGDYLLFAVGKNGTVSEGRHVLLKSKGDPAND